MEPAIQSAAEFLPVHSRICFLVVALILSAGADRLPVHKNLASIMSFHNCGACKGSLKLLISDHRQGLQHQGRYQAAHTPQLAQTLYLIHM